MKFTAFAVALVFLVSSVMADFGLQAVPVGAIATTVDNKNNNIVALSKSERMQVANVIKEVMANNPETNQIAANLILEQLEQDSTSTSTVANVATNRAVISHAVNAIFSAASGNPAAAIGHTVGLIGAAYPVVMAPASTPMATRYRPSITITMTPAARGVPASSMDTPSS